MCGCTVFRKKFGLKPCPKSEPNGTKILAAQRHIFSVNALIHKRGLVRLQQGRFAEAEPLFRRAVKVDKRSADAHHHLAIALTGLQRVEEAIPCYQKALGLRPRYAEAHNVNNRIAAYMLAIDRVAYTTKQRGIYA